MKSSRQVACGDAVLAADIWGEGDPVVFLHAAIGDRRMWQEVADPVGRRGMAIAYDRRGVGQTQAGTQASSAVDDLAAVIDALAGGRKAVLVGCSEGGRIAIDAALRYPARVRGLVLISPSVTGAPAPTYPPGIAQLMGEVRHAQSVGDWERVIALKARLFLDGPAAAEGRVAGPARALFAEMNATALRLPSFGASLDGDAAYHRLEEIAVPTLVLCGDLDLSNIQVRSRHVAEAVARGSFQVLEGAAHLPSLEQPALVAGVIERWLEGSILL